MMSDGAETGEIAGVPEEMWRRPERSLVAIRVIEAGAIAAAIGVGPLLVAVFRAAGLPWWPVQTCPAGLALPAAFFVFWVVVAVREANRFRYALRPFDLVVSYGVLVQVRRTIPRARVQHVDIQSGPLERAFGVVRLVVHTAGNHADGASIRALTPADAEALRSALQTDD